MTHTISQILINSSERTSLATYANWTTDEFVTYWDDVQRRGGRIPKTIDRVLKRVIHKDHLMNMSPELPGLGEVIAVEGTADVPIDTLIKYFPNKGNSIAVNRLRSGGVTNIEKLITISSSDLKNIPYIGATTLQRAITFKQWVITHQQELVDEYRQRSAPILLPAEYDATMPLLGVLHSVLLEASRMLLERASDTGYARTPRDVSGMRMMGRLLSLRYGSLLTFAEIATVLHRTPWHITKSHTDFVGALCKGEDVGGNLRLHPELMERLRNVQEKTMFRRDRIFGSITAIDTTLLNILGLDILNVTSDIKIVIPARELCYYTGRTRAIMRTLRSFVMPISREDFDQELAETKEYRQEQRSGDEAFANALLCQSDLVNTLPNGHLALCISHFVSDEQRIARIIHDHGGWMTRSEIFEQYRTVMGHDSNIVNLSNLRKYGIHSSGDLWIFGKKLKPINHYISAWAREHRIFRMEQLERDLSREGYPILSRIRAYITTECMVDNDDANHFCHKSAAADYPEYNWRQPGRTGLTNWILMQIRELTIKGSISYTALTEEITSRAIEEGKEAYIRQRIKAALTQYSGEGKPFLLSRGQVSVNPEVIDTINFATIGRRGHHRTAEYERIRVFAIDTLAQDADKRVPLVQFMKLLAEVGLGDTSRNSVIRALTSKHLGPIPVKLENVDGTLCLLPA